MTNAEHRYRWAVWLDGQGPRITSSRRQAKRLARKAKANAYLCRHYADDPDSGLTITDFVVWELGQRGQWFRCLWLCGDVPLNATAFGERLARSARERERYVRALRNESMWKLGRRAQLNAAGVYPACFRDFTLDSAEAMACAGFRCVAEFRSLRQMRQAHQDALLPECCYGTVDDGLLLVWIDEEDHECPSSASSGASPVKAIPGMTAI